MTPEAQEQQQEAQWQQEEAGTPCWRRCCKRRPKSDVMLCAVLI